MLSKYPIRYYPALLVCSRIIKTMLLRLVCPLQLVLGLSVLSKWWWRRSRRFSETCIGKALEVLLHRVASLSSSVLCKEREVNPMRLTNPCQGPALSRTQGVDAKYGRGSVPGLVWLQVKMTVHWKQSEGLS